jgi:DNA-binding SARP family transcriptional activator
MDDAQRSTAGNGVRIQLLGGFALTRDGESIDVPTGSQRAAAYVAFNDRPVSRARVAAILWLDKTNARACANLRSALWRLNRIGVEVISSRGPFLELAPGIAVDVREFNHWTGRLERGTPAEGDLDFPLPSGELLEEWYDDWVVVERERIRQRSLHALEELSRRLAERGRYGRGIEAALTAVTAEPLRESAHRALIAVHLAEGNAAEALRQFERYRQLLDEELGVSPSGAMEDLVTSFRPQLASSSA